MSAFDPGELRRLVTAAGARVPPVVLAGLVLLPLLAGTVAGSVYFSRSADEQEDRRYRDHAQTVSGQLEDRLVQDVTNLFVLKGFVDGAGELPSHAAFHNWTQGSGWDQRAPGFLSAGLATHVPPGDAEAHWADLREDPNLTALGYPDPGPAPTLDQAGFILDHRVPPQGPGPTFASDLTAGSDARTIIQTAVDRGRPAILGAVNLDLDASNRSQAEGLYVLLLPIYGTVEPGTVEHRRASVQGLVVSVHDIRASLAPAISELTASGHEVRIELYEILEQEGEDAGPSAVQEPPDALASLPGFDPLGYVPVSVGASTWPLYVHRPGNLLSTAEELAPGLTLAGGATLSLAVAALTYLLAAGRQRAHRMAEAMTREARAATTSLSRAHADLERFTYAAAHHMQEPVRMVSLYTRLLQRQYADDLDDAANEYIEYAADGAVRIHDLLNDLLEYASLQHGIETEDTDLDEVVEGAIARLEADADRPPAEIHVDPLPTIHGDPALLSQVFYHLLVNAFKFSPEGQRPRVEIRAVEQDDAWEVVVEDNGIGIEPRHHARLFHLFERVENPRDQEGTGAGLAICRRILELHGGRIWIDEGYEAGARFHLLFPKLASDAGPLNQPPPVEVGDAGRPREARASDRETP